MTDMMTDADGAMAFVPQENITTYELALIVNLLHSVALPSIGRSVLWRDFIGQHNLWRHFETIEEKIDA